MRGIIVPTACLLLCALGGIACAQDWPSAQGTVAILQQVDAELAQAELVGDPAIYTSNNLAEYLRDKAKRYFAYDYQWTVASSFTDLRSRVRVSADVYRFASDLDAFGAYSIDRDPRVPGEVIPLAGQASLVAAYWSGNQLHVWRGPLYVRLVPADAKPALRPAVLVLGQSIVERLPVVKRDPPVFAIPPTRNLVVESVKFQRRDVLGDSALKNALIGTYGRRTGERELAVDMELLLLDGGDKNGAQQTYAALQRLLAKGGAVRPVGALGQAAITVRHAEYGKTYAMKQGRYVAMLRRVRNAQAAEAVLREIGKNIRLAK